jgi:hypothetical protein
MNKDLLTYLHDHLAGAIFAIELLEALRDQDSFPEAAGLAAKLVEEIRLDKGSLETFIGACGGDDSSSKNLVSWIAEKASHHKLNVKTSLGIFESIEFLCLGVLGKRSLWDALGVAANGSQADQAGELERLKGRAGKQYAELEAFRLRLSHQLFQGWDAGFQCLRYEQALTQWAKTHDVDIRHKHFAAGKAGEFDGKTLTVNSTYGPQERLYYAAHAVGSIVIWSQDPAAIQSMFDELRKATKRRSEDPELLASAIVSYRKFETQSSELAVWILAHLGGSSEIANYSNQMRADLEAMTQFHEIGTAPVWSEFFARWNREVASGERRVAPFEPREVADFQAKGIEKQEILQRQ